MLADRLALTSDEDIPQYGFRNSSEHLLLRSANNNKLTELFEADQTARQDKNIGWTTLRGEDALRW